MTSLMSHAPSSTRIEAVQPSDQRTRLRRSTTAWRSAPTDWSSTSGCRRTAWWSSTTMRTSSARPTGDGPVADHRRPSSRGWMRATASSRRGAHGSRSAARASAYRRWHPSLALSGRAAHHRAEAGFRATVRHRATHESTWCGRRRSCRVALGSFSGGALRTARRLEPALRTGAGREETRWALYRSWVRLAARPAALSGVPGAGTMRARRRW